MKRFIAEGYVRPTLACEFRRLDLEVEEVEEEVQAEVAATVTVATTVIVGAAAVAVVAVAIHRSLYAVFHHRDRPGRDPDRHRHADAGRAADTRLP